MKPNLPKHAKPRIRFIAPCLALLLLCLHSLAAATGDDYGRLKGEYFFALLHSQSESEKNQALENWKKASMQRAENAIALARQGKFREKKRGPYIPAHGYKIEELDMIQRSKELSKDEKAKLTKIFQSARQQFIKIQRQQNDELAALKKNQPSDKIQGLFEREFEIAQSAIMETVKIIHASHLDKDYAFRAYLREHRRLNIQN